MISVSGKIWTEQKINKNLVLSHWNEDPIMPGLDYSKRNLSNITKYSNLVDYNFITSHQSIFNKNKGS